MVLCPVQNLQAGKRATRAAGFVLSVSGELTSRSALNMSPGYKLLYEAPYKDFDSKGVEGLFEQPDVLRLLKILRDFEPQNAA